MLAPPRPPAKIPGKFVGGPGGEGLALIRYYLYVVYLSSVNGVANYQRCY